MNFRELSEDGPIENFADRAEHTLKGVGDLAKGALRKIKDAKDQEHAEVKSATEKKEKEDTVAAEKNKKAQALKKAGPRTAAATVAHIILDRTPEAEDMPELEDLDVENFAHLQNAVDQISSRFRKFVKVLTKNFRTAPYINAIDRKEVPERLGDQNDRVVESAETMLMQDKFGERDAWMKALLDDDTEVGGKALVNMIGRISDQHSKMNQAQNKKVYADGLNLLNLIGAQRQIIEMRIELMRTAVDQLADRPAMNEALFKRVRKLAKKL